MFAYLGVLVCLKERGLWGWAVGAAFLGFAGESDWPTLIILT